MRAIALLGPNAGAEDVAEFAVVGRAPISIEKTLTERRDAALVFGGDGTVHRHLRALVETNTPALVVPMGSGNDFARAAGIKSRAVAKQIWRRFCESDGGSRTYFHAIDLGEISPLDARRPASELFCCVGGAGIDAETNRRANRLPAFLRAHGGYALSVAGAAMAFRPAKMRVECEDCEGKRDVIEDEAMMCAFANAPRYGHGMKIAPAARMDDGLLDLVFVRRAGPARLLTLFPTVYFGGHMGLKEVEYRRVRRLGIASEPALDIYADGEFICRTPAEISIRPRALTVIV